MEDAKLAARRGIVVDTTCARLPALPSFFLPKDLVPQVPKTQMADLKLLRDYDVRLAIGSDNSDDTSVKEVEYLRWLVVFDDLTLLKTWTENTARSIFPQRKLGLLQDGYEASFLAPEGNPLKHSEDLRKINLRFMQGFVIKQACASPISESHRR